MCANNAVMTKEVDQLQVTMMAMSGKLQDEEIIDDVCQQRSDDQECDPASHDSDEDGNFNLETPKTSEVLSMCAGITFSAESCSEKALNSLISLQNEVYTVNARKVKQAKLSDFFKAGPIWE